MVNSTKYKNTAKCVLTLYREKTVPTLTDFILDVPHEWSKSRLIGTVRVAQHSALQEVLLLWILLK